METAPPEAITADAAGDVQDPPRFGRALLALAAAATIAIAPVAAIALAPADSGRSAHSIPVYLFGRLSHDVGHNEWAFAGTGNDTGLIEWAACYAALGLFWLAVAMWVRAAARGRAATRSRVAARSEVSGRSGVGAEGGGVARNTGHGPGTGYKKIWWQTLLAAWATEAVLGCLTVGVGLVAERNSWPPDAFILHATDLCSPWWSCVAVALVVARAERSSVVLRAAVCYGLLLAVFLIVPLPFPAVLKALVLAVPAAIPAVMTPRDPAAVPAAPAGPAAVGLRPDHVGP
jgi:hypothetical protein